MNSLIIIALAASVVTMMGGLAILKFQKYTAYFFAFAAGTMLAVTFLELLPESLELAKHSGIEVRAIAITIVLAFFAYSMLERFFAPHHIHDHNGHGHAMGPIGATTIIAHSLLDGIAIGAAFQVDFAVGLVVALAVIFHDFTDGINTVAVMLKNKHSKRSAFGFLLLDAVAPVAGILLTAYIVIPENLLAYILAIFVGEFLYIAAATLVPETHGTPKKTMLAMAAGILLMIVLTGTVHHH